ncbi:MFS transporter, partial [Enterobacter hormaechei]
VAGGLISSVMIVLMFSDFFGLAKSSNTTLFIIVFVISFVILDAFYSFKDIAFWSMIPALSEKNEERETLGTFARFGSAIGSQGTTILVIP